MTRNELRKMLDEIFNPKGYSCTGEGLNETFEETYDLVFTHNGKLPEMIVSVDAKEVKNGNHNRTITR